MGYDIPLKTNPCDFLLDIATPDQRSSELKQQSFDRISLFKNAWQQYSSLLGKPTHRDIGYAILPKPPRFTVTRFFKEIGTLMSRNLKEMFRDPEVILAYFGQAVIIVLIMGFLFWQLDLTREGIQDRLGVLFFISTNLAYGIVFPNVVVFAQQRALIKRERAGCTYRSYTSYLARIGTSLPMVTMVALIIALPVYWMIGLQRVTSKYLNFILIVLVQSHTANAIGLMIGSMVPTVNMGQIVAPLFLMIMLLFGGQLINLNRMTFALRWLQYLSIIGYTNKALAQNEFSGLSFPCPPAISNGTSTAAANATQVARCTESGEHILSTVALDNFGFWDCILVNAGFMFGFYILGYIAYHYTTAPLRKLK